MIVRHLRTVPPLFSYGRLFIPGNDRVIAVDGYNGTELWDRQIANSLRVSIPYDTSYMAADQNRLYVATGEKCLIISAQVGQDYSVFSISELIGRSDRHWSYVAVADDMLFGSAKDYGLAYRTKVMKQLLITTKMIDRLSSAIIYLP